MRNQLLILLAMCLSGAAGAAPSLEAVTTHPSDNFFAIGAVAEAELSAKGFAPGARCPVALEVFDFTRTNRVAALKGELAADSAGAWRGRFTLPTDRYGIYYVRAEAGGVGLGKVGTAPRGFFTYGVLEDPAKMPDLDPWDAFLGEHAANYTWLWQRGGLGSALEPSPSRLIIASTDRVASEGKIGTARFWTILTNEAVQAEYRANLSEYVKKAVAAGAGRQGRRIYENLWEPNLRAPNAESIVAAQKVAWETIHALDPDALVGAYTSSGIDLRMLRTLMEKGLGRYMNAVTVHPYKGMPELGGFIDDVRGMKRIVREYVGRDLPLFATESGMNEANTPDGEKRKLCGQLRQALILFGEGFQMYCPFYGCDFGADANNQDDGDYGLNYNLQYPKVRFGCKVSQPRPIFGALAAFARLTEGHRPTCCIEWLGETVLGYAFTDKADSDSVIALWDWGARGTSVELPVGRDVVEVADVMGNVSRMKTEKGALKLALSEYPQYVLHADPKIWGRAAQAKLKWSERRFKGANELAPVGVAALVPAFVGREPGVAVTLENRTDATQRVEVETRIPGEPDCRRKVPVSVPAHGERRVTVAFEGFRPCPTDVFETLVRVKPSKGTVAEASARLNFMQVPCEFTFGACHVKLACDRTALKFDVTVADATPLNGKSGWWSWDGDSLQVALAKQHLAKRTQNDVADAFAEAYSEYTVAKTPRGDEVCRTITWDPKRYPSDSGRGGIVGEDLAPRRVSHDGKRWRYRFSIPWRFLNMDSLAPGATFRMALQYNDRASNDSALRQVECFKMKLAAPSRFGWFVIGK
jgi:hypothetical protein